MNEDVTFETLPVPYSLGTVRFRPTIESIKKLGYGVDDETGWLLGDPKAPLAHPVVLSTYIWWPQGFYIQEEGAIGHFKMFMDQFPNLFEYPYLHAKTHARFISPFKAGEEIVAKVGICEKYIRRAREFVVIEALFSTREGAQIAEYRHTIMVRSHAPIRGIASGETK